MKKLNLFFLLFLGPMMVFGQTGNTNYGTNTLMLNTTGSYNSAFGYNALLSNQTSSYNTAVGYHALFANRGPNNTAVGYQALYNITTGGGNTAIGVNALLYNANNYNTAVGVSALEKNVEGGYNTAVGYDALCNNKNSFNTAIGMDALLFNTTGLYNTAIGVGAGNGYGNQSNVTSIGYGADPIQSNEIRLGNQNITRIGGFVGWSNYSDARVKKNIRSEVPGLAFINLLQPVTYNFDMDAIDEIQKSDDPAINSRRENYRKGLSPEELQILDEARENKGKQVYSGFIAQDVEKAAKSISYDFSGVDAPENDKSTYMLRYAEFVVPLVKAVQELSEQNNKLQEQLTELTAKMEKLTENQNVTVYETSETAKDFSISLYPNPTNGLVTVNYSLYEDTSISIEIYSIMGQRLKTVLSNQYKTMGDYSVQASVSNLNTGTYLVKAVSKNQIESLQLIVNK